MAQMNTSSGNHHRTFSALEDGVEINYGTDPSTLARMLEEGNLKPSINHKFRIPNK
jgi:hypothetical protein